MSPESLNLHPEALQDLRRSGLSDPTIAEAGLYTPAPGELSRLLSPRLIASVRHVLVFPYDEIGHGGLWRRNDDFVRCKLFPPVSDGQGHTIRYYQRGGTPPRLYIPVRARAALADPTIALVIAEGEKKALKANQEGLACVAVGGLWNWQTAGRPIADLDRIDWYEREAVIVPDSDVWTRPDLLQPVFALGKELEGRGARVSVLKLPAGPGGAKVGLDDYLCANPRQAFDALPRLALKHAAFSRTSAWWRGWVKRKETEPRDGHGEPSVLELLERGETTRFLHPALDVVDGVLYYGVPVGDKLTIVTSKREGFTPETLPAGFALRHVDPGPSTIRHETAAAWLGGRADGSVAHALDGLAAFLARYVALRDPGAALWLGAWALGTWCYRAFRVFPYLSVRSAERRCGKSRMMRLLCRVGFNASPPTTHPTEAQLYREAARRSGVQAFDEMESLKSGADKERLATLISVLNVGFEQGGAVSRQEKRGERFVEVLYEVYAPRVLAGIAGLKETLEDRSLTLVMFRRRKDEPVARLGRETETEAQALRDACALACLRRIEDILQAYELAPKVLDRQDVDDRAVDLWAPLLSLVMVADAEAGGDRSARILRAAREVSDARDADDEAGSAARLIAALQNAAAAVGTAVTPTRLLEALQENGYVWVKSTRRLAGLRRCQIGHRGFPSGEGVQLGGWDGIVAVDEGNAFVPGGVSAWELGTGKDIKGKADDDYEKRRGDPGRIDPADSTFVFVTPRRWKGKAAWVAARERERVWRAVRAYDADDLEAWLELAPAVHVWLSILLGKLPENAVDLGTWWIDWAGTTSPPVSPELILSGREESVEKVHAWLRDPSAPLALQAESRDEAMAVFAAAVQQLPPDERVAHLARALVVRDLPAWHRLAASGESLILVPVFEIREAIARAARGGHRVVVALGRADSASGMTLVVPRLTQEGATKTLLAAGVPEERAHELAVLARRSLMSFRRRLAVRPEIEQPEWARPGQARSLLPALLAGSWSDASEADREALATLARVPYHEVSEIAVRWSNESDPPARRIGDTWFIVSREDGWSLLARYLTRDDLERLEAVVLDVLGGPDSRFDLPESERWMWMARALGRAPRHSDVLRRGLAETLAVMGARGETVTVSTGASPSQYAARIVRRLLERANTDWRLWASLSPVLPLLAEAAPDEFLTAVGQGLSGAEPVLLKLFAEQTDPLFGSSPHTGLLWALETVAWSPEHLGHAASLLASLARLDPGGRLANRPMNSLRGIFLLWHPQTTAGLAQRLSVLDMLRRSEPDVAWELLRQLLPEHHGIGFNTATPSWRDWAAGPPRVTRGEYVKAVREITSRMLADADQSGLRWETLIEALARLPVDQHEAIVSRLGGMEIDRLGSEDRALIWNALRRLISQHRSFADADWALPAERVDRLEEIHRRFEPVEPVGRYAWLFSDRPELPEGGEQDVAAYREAIAQARLDAVRSIHAEGGLPALLECARHAERPGELGVTLGHSELLTEQEDQVLGEFLGADDRVLAEVARGFAAGRVSRRGREWAETKLAEIAGTWSPAQRAELLACLPCDPRT